MSKSTPEIKRQQLIRNMLSLAASCGLPVVLAAQLDQPVRVHDPETDQPIYVPLRALTADHVRAQ